MQHTSGSVLSFLTQRIWIIFLYHLTDCYLQVGLLIFQKRMFLVLSLCSMFSYYSYFKRKIYDFRSMSSHYTETPPSRQFPFGMGGLYNEDWILSVWFFNWCLTHICKETFGIVKLMCCCNLIKVVHEKLRACISACSLSKLIVIFVYRTCIVLTYSAYKFLNITCA